MPRAPKKPAETNGLVWEEPRPKKAGRGPSPEIEALLIALQSRPGEWARLATDKARGGYVQALKRRGCEKTVRTLGPNEYAVYVRWPKDGAA